MKFILGIFLLLQFQFGYCQFSDTSEPVDEPPCEFPYGDIDECDGTGEIINSFQNLVKNYFKQQNYLSESEDKENDLVI